MYSVVKYVSSLTSPLQHMYIIEEENISFHI